MSQYLWQSLLHLPEVLLGNHVLAVELAEEGEEGGTFGGFVEAECADDAVGLGADGGGEGEGDCPFNQLGAHLLVVHIRLHPRRCQVLPGCFGVVALEKVVARAGHLQTRQLGNRQVHFGEVGDQFVEGCGPVEVLSCHYSLAHLQTRLLNTNRSTTCIGPRN
mgnify:CR=1 FL=1